jgi:hypothetical protein
MWYLMEGETVLLEVTSSSLLEEWLYQFRQQFGAQHRVLTLQGEYASMNIGIADDFGFLNHLSNDWHQPGYAAIGNPAFGRLDAPVAFYFHTHKTEVSSRYCLPFSVLMAVVVEFAETGQLAAAVEWEEV